MLVAKRNNLIEMKVKYSRFRHNAEQTSFTSPTGPRRHGDEHEHAQYPTNDEEVAYSKKRTQFKTRVHTPYPISDQNGRNWYPISDQNGWKPYPLAPHIPI